jgi:hypothetical protein
MRYKNVDFNKRKGEIVVELGDGIEVSNGDIVSLFEKKMAGRDYIVRFGDEFAVDKVLNSDEFIDLVGRLKRVELKVTGTVLYGLPFEVERVVFKYHSEIAFKYACYTIKSYKAKFKEFWVVFDERMTYTILKLLEFLAECVLSDSEFFKDMEVYVSAIDDPHVRTWAKETYELSLERQFKELGIKSRWVD